MKAPTYLWLDLGNTRLKYWLIQGDKIIAFDAKEHLKAPNELLLGLLGSFLGYKPCFIGVSSVLGTKINHTLSTTLGTLGIPFAFANVDCCHPILKTDYQACELGVDRWLQMLGAADGSKLCVVGCGTALTLDIIDQDTHKGGYILPNAYMQRHALYAGTQQIAVKAGRFVDTKLGINTFDAVNHGILFGIVAAIDTFCATYPDHKLLLTGGGAMMIAPHLKTPATIRDELLLIGLQRYFNLEQ